MTPPQKGRRWPRRVRRSVIVDFETDELLVVLRDDKRDACDFVEGDPVVVLSVGELRYLDRAIKALRGEHADRSVQMGSAGCWCIFCDPGRNQLAGERTGGGRSTSTRRGG